MRADVIIDDLIRAFPAARPAELVALASAGSGEEASNVASVFADKPDWTTLQSEWLDAVPDGLGSALSFLSDAAIRFYIPAYLVADLKGELGRAEPLFALTHGFVWPGSDAITAAAWARWNDLTPAQALAIVHYLEWCIERDGADIAYDAVAALDNYWRARAA